MSSYKVNINSPCYPANNPSNACQGTYISEIDSLSRMYSQFQRSQYPHPSNSFVHAPPSCSSVKSSYILPTPTPLLSSSVYFLRVRSSNHQLHSLPIVILIYSPPHTNSFLIWTRCHSKIHSGFFFLDSWQHAWRHSKFPFPYSLLDSFLSQYSPLDYSFACPLLGSRPEPSAASSFLVSPLRHSTQRSYLRPLGFCNLTILLPHVHIHGRPFISQPYFPWPWLSSLLHCTHLFLSRGHSYHEPVNSDLWQFFSLAYPEYYKANLLCHHPCSVLFLLLM